MSFSVSQRLLVVDTDPGVDDAVALLTAVRCGLFKLLGVTTCFGNAVLTQTTENALRLLTLFGRPEVPVYAGAEKPRLGDAGSSFPVLIHGSNALGDIHLPPATRVAEDVSAAEFLVDVCNRHPKKVHIVVLGRMTNLAAAIDLDPDLPSKWGAVVIMGGAFRVPGNETPVAEANFCGDPFAADFVFRRGENLFVVGLDATHQCPMTAEDLEKLSEVEPYGPFLRAIYAPYLRFYTDVRPDVGGAPPHDAVAVMALIHPELFEWEMGTVAVAVDGKQKGESRLSYHATPHQVAIDASGAAIVQRMMSYITGSTACVLS